jgi:hypothetical protein
MIQLPPDFKEFLKLLATHNVKYLVVGGYAVNAFGYVRNTIDLDVWIASDPENLARTISAVREFGFVSAGEDLLAEHNAMLRMGVPPLRIKVMKSISGVTFEDCWARKIVIRDNDFEVPLISLADLKANKQAAGRPKDLVDLEELS